MRHGTKTFSIVTNEWSKQNRTKKNGTKITSVAVGAQCTRHRVRFDKLLATIIINMKRWHIPPRQIFIIAERRRLNGIIRIRVRMKWMVSWTMAWIVRVRTSKLSIQEILCTVGFCYLFIDLPLITKSINTHNSIGRECFEWIGPLVASGREP